MSLYPRVCRGGKKGGEAGKAGTHFHDASRAAALAGTTRHVRTPLRFWCPTSFESPITRPFMRLRNQPILLRRGPFLRVLREGEPWHAIAERFGTTSTSVVLRAGELTGRPLAVVTPAHVYARGEARWPDEQTIRRWARHGAPGVRRAVLRDEPKRVVLEGEEDAG